MKFNDLMFYIDEAVVNEIVSNLPPIKEPPKKGDIVHVKSLNVMAVVTLVAGEMLVLAVIADMTKKPKLFTSIILFNTKREGITPGDTVQKGKKEYVAVSVTEHENPDYIETGPLGDKSNSKYKMVIRYVEVLGGITGSIKNTDDIDVVDFGL